MSPRRCVFQSSRGPEVKPNESGELVCGCLCDSAFSLSSQLPEGDPENQGATGAIASASFVFTLSKKSSRA